jgi:hypothetical protein
MIFCGYVSYTSINLLGRGGGDDEEEGGEKGGGRQEYKRMKKE